MFEIQYGSYILKKQRKTIVSYKCKVTQGMITTTFHTVQLKVHVKTRK